ncbi:MAG: hypothetical protein R3A78_07745 [Polyangiales bacterium]
MLLAACGGGARREATSLADVPENFDLSPSRKPPPAKPPEPAVVMPDGVRVRFDQGQAILGTGECDGNVGPGEWVEFCEVWDVDEDGRDELVLVVRRPDGLGSAAIVDMEQKRIQFRATLSRATTARRDAPVPVIGNDAARTPDDRDEGGASIASSHRFEFIERVVIPDAFGPGSNEARIDQISLVHDTATDTDTPSRESEAVVAQPIPVAQLCPR